MCPSARHSRAGAPAPPPTERTCRPKRGSPARPCPFRAPLVECEGGTAFRSKVKQFEDLDNFQERLKGFWGGHPHRWRSVTNGP